MRHTSCNRRRMGWNDRIAQALAEKGWSIAELSRRTGIPRESMYKYVQGRVAAPRGDIMSRLADALGVSVVWIMHGTLPEGENKVAVTNLALVNIGRWNGELMALEHLKRTATEHVPVPDGQDIGPKAIAFRVDDDALTRIPHGSIAVADPDRPPEPSRYVLAWSSVVKRAVVRRWRATDYSGAGQLVADNADYPPLPMSSAEDGYVVGRIVLVISEL